MTPPPDDANGLSVPPVQASADNQQVAAILRAREARGLVVPLLARLLLVTFGIVVVGIDLAQPAHPTDPQLTALVLGTLVLALSLNAYLLVRLRQGRGVERVGLSGAVFDALFVFVLAALAQRAGAAQGLAAGFAFQTELPITMLAVVVVNGLALRPRYPLIVGVGALAALGWTLALTWSDPRTVASTEMHEIYPGTSVDPTGIATIVAMTALGVGATCWAAHVARATVRRGVAQEVENARLEERQLQLVLREKIQALGGLVAGISHELNTPLGALRSSVDTQHRVLDRLETSMGDGVDGGARRLLTAGRNGLSGMRAATERISALESSLRALSHLDESEMKRVSVRDELEVVLATASRKRSDRPRVELEVETVPEVYWRARELNQALLTLVDNAFDAAGPGGAVRVRARVRDEVLHIDVADDGPGIEPARLQQIFDVQLASKGERVAASLGLPTAQAIVQRHGGDIRAESQVGEGTTFAVRVPLARATRS